MRAISIALMIAACACGGGGAFNLHAAPVGGVAGPGDRVVAVVRIPTPWYAPRFMVARRFRAAVPQYEALPELEAKAFTIADDGRFGGIYQWSSRGAADAFYSASWRRDIQQRRGHDPDLVVLDAPFEIRGRAAITGPRLGARSMRYDATATLVLGAATDPHALAQRVAELDGVVSGAAVVDHDSGRVGFVALWATRALARAGVRALGLGADTQVSYFDAPVQIGPRAPAQVGSPYAASSDRASATATCTTNDSELSSRVACASSSSSMSPGK
jgi:hypothetical protein